ncbi:hypothetical protein [uncultured Aquimarina sp.]|uniref:hypothetical protein n=1 Tax=uncultured Aquimarina sp. TaxID=575652 RepID=UPI00260F34DA|nr:hypothetical protein [uncultured Aquimarina sp.]
MRRIVILILVVLSCLSIWYLFIKEYDYQITFKVKMAPGSLYYELCELKSWGDQGDNKIEVLDTILFKKVVQKVGVENTGFVLDWNFKAVNDSVTKITVGIVSEQKSIKNRLQVLTGSSDFVDSYKNQMIKFNNKLIDYTNSFKVYINGESTIPEVKYVSTFMKAKRSEKASKMIMANSDLYLSIPRNSIKQEGHPVIKVKHWDFKSDSIQFDFGFPVKNKDAIVSNSITNYNEQVSQKALKATYYGNYKNSDQAWFALIEYARINAIEIEKKPFEIFYNNPMQGGDELQWKAEVFLPIK